MLRIPVNFARMAPALEVTSILVNFKLVPRLLSPIWTSFFPSLEGSRFDRVWIAHSIRRLEAIPLALSFFVPVNPLLLRLNYAAFTRLLPYKKSWHEVHFKVSSKTHLKLCWFESVATLSFHWWGLFKSLCGAKKYVCPWTYGHMDWCLLNKHIVHSRCRVKEGLKSSDIYTPAFISYTWNTTAMSKKAA